MSALNKREAKYLLKNSNDETPVHQDDSVVCKSDFQTIYIYFHLHLYSKLFFQSEWD